MNYKVFLKSRDLPLKPNETAVTLVIASYTGKDNATSFPSYETIHRQTQASDEIIKDTIDLLRNIGVLDYKNRADILTGKQSNLYNFKFEHIKYDRRYLIPANDRKRLKKRITKERALIKAARKKRAKNRKKAAITYVKIPYRRGDNKPQNPHVGVCDTQGYKRLSNTPSTGVNTPPTGGRSIETVETRKNCDKRLSNNISNNKSQKMVLQDENMKPVTGPVHEVVHNEGIIREKTTKVSAQTNEEWLNDYENG